MCSRGNVAFSNLFLWSLEIKLKLNQLNPKSRLEERISAFLNKASLFKGNSFTRLSRNKEPTSLYYQQPPDGWEKRRCSRKNNEKRTATGLSDNNPLRVEWRLRDLDRPSKSSSIRSALAASIKALGKDQPWNHARA